MPAYAVIGAQWGDEGKGKIIDFLAENAAVIGRYSGGNNVGHTVINDAGTFKRHLVPSGICWPHTMNVIGNGVVVDPDVLLKETNEDELDPQHLAVSDRAHLILPYQVIRDQPEECRWRQCRHRHSSDVESDQRTSTGFRARACALGSCSTMEIWRFGFRILSRSETG